MPAHEADIISESDIPENTGRYKVVLFDDDPATTALLKTELEHRGLEVKTFLRGDEVLAYLKQNPDVSVLLTDIEIRYPFPDGLRSGPQGYDVANRVPEVCPNRLLGVVVMTGLDQAEAFESLGSFQVRAQAFSKMRWLQASDTEEKTEAFDRLATLLRTTADESMQRWLEELKTAHPANKWVMGGYWDLYRTLWYRPDWKAIEAQIGQQAIQIIDGYREGEAKKLRGEVLSFSKKPDELSFQNHLVGRRVVYGLKARRPSYWDDLIRGEAIVEDQPMLPPGAWEQIETEEVRALVNELNRIAARQDLEKTYKELEKTTRALEQADGPDPALEQAMRKLNSVLQQVRMEAEDAIAQLNQALEQEQEETQQLFKPYLRFWGLDFRTAKWATQPEKSTGGSDPVTQLLLLLGIRREDIALDNPKHWLFLLPEERAWLRELQALTDR